VQEARSWFVFTPPRTFYERGLARIVKRAGAAGPTEIQSALATCCDMLDCPHDTRLAGLPRRAQHPAHRELHGILADSVQGLLAELTSALPPVLSSVPAKSDEDLAVAGSGSGELEPSRGRSERAM
jgi:hypothetical protein